MLNNHLDLYNINLYNTNSQNKTNNKKNNELNKIHSSSSNSKNININSYKISTTKINNQMPSKHLKYIPYPNRYETYSSYDTQNKNLDKMVNTIKNNLMNKENNNAYFIKKDPSKKNIRNNSANISKNIFYPSDKKKGISLNLNKDNQLYYIYNSITNDYDIKNNKINYSYYKHHKYSPNKKNSNHKLSTISNRYNNYIINKDEEININKILNSIKPMFHTTQNFYRYPKKKNPTYIFSVEPQKGQQAT